MFRKFLQLLTILLVFFMGTKVDAEEQQYDPENVLYMQLKDGLVKIELLPQLAPHHVAKIKKLVRKKFYDGLKFHRVIDGFMVQTGDPMGNGTGGSGETINAEFSQEKHVRGIVSMARAMDANSADSQFFIMLGNAPSLDGQYTVFGKVISGMEYVDKIKKGDLTKNGAVLNPDKIISIRVESDLIKSGLLKK